METIVQKDLIYDPKSNLPLDLYRPARPNGFGLIVIHGGGWFHGDKSKDEDWAGMFAEAGYTVAVPNYRLAPEHPYPAARDDIMAAHAWFAGRPGLKGLGVAGGSSGGNLAIELSLARGLPAVSLSGIIDLDEWIAKHPDVQPKKDARQDFSHTASAQIDQTGPDDPFYKWFVLNYVNGDPALLKDASLLHRVTSQAGPMLLANSLHELSPVDAVLRLQEKLLAVNVPVLTKFISGSQHAKGYLKVAQSYALAFFEEYLLREKAPTA